MTARHRTAWTFAITSTALFMASLDNLVVTASLEGLQWTVNAYTLTFAVLLLTGATLGERYGRRRLFTIGLGLFTAGSAAAAMAPGIGALVVEGASWQWIFWLNVPIGIALLPIARLRLTESRGPSTSLDLPGLVLASVGLLGIVLRSEERRV